MSLSLIFIKVFFCFRLILVFKFLVGFSIVDRGRGRWLMFIIRFIRDFLNVKRGRGGRDGVRGCIRVLFGVSRGCMVIEGFRVLGLSETVFCVRGGRVFDCYILDYGG